jgi:ribosomal protein L23
MATRGPGGRFVKQELTVNTVALLNKDEIKGALKKMEKVTFGPIETGIPVPETKRTSAWREMLSQLEVGDSLTVSNVNLTTLQAACIRVGVSFTPKRQFKPRAITTEEGVAFRVWRTL